MTTAAASPTTLRIPYRSVDERVYEPTPAQIAFHTAPETIKLYGGAVGGGKTTALVCEVLTLMWEYPHNEGIIARRDFDDLRRTTYAEFQAWCPEEIIYQHHKSEHWIRLICPLHPGKACGSLVHFIDTKDLNALKNQNLGFVAFDQAEEVSYDAFIWAGTRLRLGHIPYRPRLLSANPGPGWVKKIFIQQIQPSIDDTPEKPLKCCAGQRQCLARRHRFVPALPKDNPYLPAGYVEEQVADMPEAYAKMLLEGLWDVVLNAVYTDLDRKVHFRSVPAGTVWKPFWGAIGVDYGEGHFSTVVAITIDQDNRLWVREVWAQRGGDINEIAKAVQRMCAKYHINRGRTDPRQNVLAQILSMSEDRKVQKYSFVKAQGEQGSREARIGLVQGLLKVKPGPRQPAVYDARYPALNGPFIEEEYLPGIFIDADGDGCSDLFDEATVYKWERNNAGQLRIPDRRDEDRVAGMEYGVEEIQRPSHTPSPEYLVSISRGG